MERKDQGKRGRKIPAEALHTKLEHIVGERCHVPLPGNVNKVRKGCHPRESGDPAPFLTGARGNVPLRLSLTLALSQRERGFSRARREIFIYSTERVNPAFS